MPMIHRPDVAAIQATKDEGVRFLARLLAQRPEVDRVSADHAKARQRNHFSERMEAAFGGRGS